MTVEERIAARRGPVLASEELEAFEGNYTLEAGGQDFEISLRRKNDTLVATSPLFRQADGKVVR